MKRPSPLLMNTPSVKHKKYAHRDGAALIIVLSVLVIMAGLVVAYLSRTSGDRVAAASFYEGNRRALLADSAVNIIRAQIDRASNQTQAGRPVAWASQPGMIRTFDQQGGLLNAYKLYSDDAMVSDHVNTASASELASWWESPSHFVDLNAPVVRDSGAEASLVYPIISNETLGSHTSDSNGFSVDGAPLNASDGRQKIPMPVRWLYVLEDGTTVAAVGSGTTATIPGATVRNPVVARIAFWTDDETSKLNINTASHGAFWDIPRVASYEDRDRMARFQPARREFQRYPGHPAMTSLQPAFRLDLFPDDTSFAQFAFSLSPRISPGGSEMGTQNASSSVLLDSDRLYASVDELLYQPDRESQISPEEVERARFFLTARSNSPEINLFNLPRIAIWPINAGDKKPSTLDELIAFTATVNGMPYYLQRSNPSNSVYDISSVTAWGARNRSLWNYVNFLMGQQVPGFGAETFQAKYTQPETEQITTEIFDYIRSSNLFSTALGASAYTGDVNLAPNSIPINRKPGTRVGQVTPLVVGETKGFGRIPTLSRAVFQLFISGAEAVRSDGTVVATWTPLTASSNKTMPRYSDPTSREPYNSWKLFRDGFRTHGAGTKLRLLTTGIIYFDTFDPNQGYVIPRYNFEVNVAFKGPWQVEGLTATGGSLGVQSLGFENSTIKVNIDQNQLYDSKGNSTSASFFPRVLGGVLGPHWMMQNYSYLRYPSGELTNAVTLNNLSSSSGVVNYPKLINDKAGYKLVSRRVQVHVPITMKEVPEDSGEFPLPNLADIEAGERTANIRFSGGAVDVSLVAGGPGGAGGEVVQQFEFSFPGFTKPAPAYLDDSTRSPRDTSFQFDKEKQFPISADFRNRWTWNLHQHRFYDPNTTDPLRDYADLRLVQNGDVAVSLVPKFGDKRLIAAKRNLTTGEDFEPQELYQNPAERAAVDFRFDPVNRMASRMMTPGSGSIRPGRILDMNYGHNSLPDMPGKFKEGVERTLNLGFSPDFDNGPFYLMDDAYVNRADEGSTTDFVTGTGTGATGGTGGREVAWYYDRADREENAGGQNREEFFSPSRQLPSAAMFGSLPTGVKRNKPWQTLLFRPDPGGHPGAAGLPDYLLLDFFWMPVVEPYAISEPFSSNGKINMNFQIMPFTYIQRATALHGLLKGQELLAIPNATSGSGGDVGASTGRSTGVLAADEYKMYSASSANEFSSRSYRRKVNIPETLKGFQSKFASGEIFISETQICSLPIIPEGETWSADFEQWWANYRLTGDNSRERIYADLLPRLTTRSNTYTVHYRVQGLKKRSAKTDEEAALWDETRDSVVSELRGSRVIERYIDPADNRIPDYATTLSIEQPLSDFYRWRQLSNTVFAP